MVVIALVGSGAAILKQHAFETAVVCFAHRRVYTNVGSDARQHDILDAAKSQHQFKIRRAERSLTGFVDDRLSGQGRQIRNDSPARFATDQDASARSRVTNTGADLA